MRVFVCSKEKRILKKKKVQSSCSDRIQFHSFHYSIFDTQLEFSSTLRSRLEMEKAINRQKVTLQPLSPDLNNDSFGLKASECSAGDSAAYSRNSSFGDDVIIVAAHRTALCKAKRAGFKDTFPEDLLLAPVLKAVIDKTKLDPKEVGDIVVGTVLGPGSQRAIECRVAAFYVGFPETVPVRTVNRQCSSGLQAVADVVAAIKAGFYDIGIGAGLESMTTNSVGWEGSINPKVVKKIRDVFE